MSRLQKLFSQVRPVEFARVLAFEATRRAVLPAATPSYAQTGEDIVLDNLLGHKESGFYVDVGCNHPVEISNTFRFYLRGWRGIAIDANAEFAQPFARWRPNDVFVSACVSNAVSEVDFRVYNSRALSSVTASQLYENPEHYRLERIEKLQTRPLGAILAEHSAPKKFEFLSIDVEGHDFEALQSIDLGQYQPAVILIEISGQMSVGAIAECNVAQHLSQYAYEPVAAHSNTVFFRKAL